MVLPWTQQSSFKTLFLEDVLSPMRKRENIFKYAYLVKQELLNPWLVVVSCEASRASYENCTLLSGSKFFESTCPWNLFYLGFWSNKWIFLYPCKMWVAIWQRWYLISATSEMVSSVSVWKFRKQRNCTLDDYRIVRERIIASFEKNSRVWNKHLRVAYEMLLLVSKLDKLRYCP